MQQLINNKYLSSHQVYLRIILLNHRVVKGKNIFIFGTFLYSNYDFSHQL